MARVVQRRTAPPYLLIVFVFLFLVSAAVAILFYVQNDKAARAEKLANERAAASDQAHQNLVNKDIPELVKRISGTALAADAAKQQADQALADVAAALKENASPDLVPAIKAAIARVNDYKSRIDDLTSANNQLNSDLRAAQDNLKTVTGSINAKIDDTKKSAEAVRVSFDAMVKEKEAAFDKAKAGLQAQLDEKAKRIATQDQDLAAKDADVQARDAKVNELLKVIQELKGTNLRPGEMALRKADGKVLQVVPEQQTCYIDLGEKDHVAPGLTFAVYPSGKGIPEDGKGKAKIEVTSVYPTTSLCRITESSREDPLLEGDLIANAIFSTSRQYSFVIEGDFDIYNEGKPDAQGTRKVAAMIESVGGKVGDQIGTNTDFLVLGDKPSKPAKPADDAPAATWQQYNEKLKRYDHYQQVETTAKTLQIPVLNTNRFLALTGFVPKKKAI